MSDSPPSLQPEPDATLLHRLRRRTRIWGAIAIVSIFGVVIPPCIGLFGTIFGMVSSFDQLATEGEAADPEVLARGISASLATTAVGIVLALFFGVSLIVSFIFWLVSLSQLKNPPRSPEA